MFCPKCRKEHSDDAIFCSVCGTKIGQSQSGLMGMNELDISIEKRIEIFDALARDLIELDKTYNVYNGYQKRYDSAKKATGWLSYHIGIPFAIGVGCFCVIGDNLLSLIIAIFVIMVASIFAGRKRKIDLKKYEEEIQKAQEKGVRFANAVIPYLEKYVPKDYWYAYAISAFSIYFKNGRALTMKEAINLYEEEMHRMRMENMQERILRENQKQTTYAAITASNTLFI